MIGRRLLAVMGVCVGLAMLVAFGIGQSVARQETVQSPLTTNAPLPEPLDVFELSQSEPNIAEIPQSPQQINLSFAPVIRSAAPAVASIYTKTFMRRRFTDPMFEMLFGGQLGQQSREQTSLGSGVIVDESGVVLTNAHVIEGADEITVALTDRREFIARVLLVDERTDLAVLKIDATNLPFLKFRDSDTMQVGDLVLAIGNPFGVGQTVTSGIISAQTRSTEGGRVFIQTDAAINPGNSGGALVDMGGQLIGINTMILSPSGGSNGIGFAIPADLARQAVESAATGNDTVARAWLGIEGQTVTQEIAESLGLALPNGVILSRLHPRSALLEAGLQPGDIVLDVEGLPVSDIASLDYRLGTGPLGSSLPVGFLRDGKRMDTTVKLVTAPEEPPRDTATIGGRTPLSGTTIANINPALSQENGLSPALEGVIVLQAQSGFAARYGIRPGDILREINGASIQRVADVEAALVRANGYWRIALERDGRVLRLETRG